MKIVPVVQGTSEWLSARLGIPTASSFDKIITAGGKDGKQPKASASADSYIRELLAELVMGRPLDSVKTLPMLRGNALESEAVAWYELAHDVDVERVGLITDDDGRYGCSPDGLIGEDGLGEFKCPTPQVHIGYMQDSRGMLAEYRPQLQGQLYVTGRSFVEIVSYHPDMPSVVTRVERDEAFIGLLASLIDIFCDRLAAGVEDLKSRGVEIRKYLPNENMPEPPEFISDADVEQILVAQRTAEDPIAQQREHQRKRLAIAPVVEDLQGEDPMDYNLGDLVRCGGLFYTPNRNLTAWEQCKWADEILALQMASV